MSEHILRLSRRSLITGTAAIGAMSLINPAIAFAETAAEVQAEADEVSNQLIGLQADLEEASANYYAAIEECEAAEAAMEAEQVKIDETNEAIAASQEALSTRARSMYRTGSASFIDFVLGASSFEEFTQNWDLLTEMNDSDAEMVAEAKVLREELQAAKDEYEAQSEIAEAKAAEAKGIEEDVQSQVDTATELYETLSAEAQELLEAEQAAAAIAAAEEAAAKAAAEAAAEAAAQAEAESSNSSSSSSSSGSSSSSSSDSSVVYPGTSSGSSSGSVSDYSSVVDYAMSRIGCPYVWGAEGPDSFDCSGLVTWSYGQVGKYVPHQSESQKNAAANVVSVAEARPGDVLYRYGHVGIAIVSGGSQYVHAPTFGAYVRDTDSLSWSGFTNALQFS